MIAIFALSSAAIVATSAHAALPIERWQQPSGAQVYFVNSPSLPMVDVQIDFDAGNRRDPADASGLASAAASLSSKGVLARGNLPALDENQWGEAWADLGAEMGASAGSDRMSFVLRSLTLPRVLTRAAQLASQQLGAPAFDAAIWQRDRERWSAALKEARTKPPTVAGEAFEKAVYGTHPYGYQTTPESLQRINVDAIRAFYARHIVPCRAKVSIVGALTRPQADALATQMLSLLPTDCPALTDVPDVAPLSAERDIRIPFDAAQAQVLIGQPGYKRADPDHFALTVGNYTLGGGGFVSRLMEQVREKRGLTYGVSSGFSPGLSAGAFTIGLQTRPDQANAALKLSREVLADFVKNGPTEAELKAAKDNLVGGFPLLLDSNKKLLGNVANIAWNNLPLDYLDTWTQRVNAVTAADVRAAFQRKLQPERMVTVVLGGE